jgi:hypothetical protein
VVRRVVKPFCLLVRVVLMTKLFCVVRRVVKPFCLLVRMVLMTIFGVMRLDLLQTFCEEREAAHRQRAHQDQEHGAHGVV